MKDSCLKRLRNQDRQYYLGGRVGIQFGELCCCSAEAGAATSEIRRATAFLHCGVIVPMGAASPEYFTRGKVPQRMERDGRNNRQNSRQSPALIAGPGPSVGRAQQGHCYDDDRKKTEAHSDLL